MSKLKLFEMFAGYGGASFSLKKAGIDFECVGYSEIDKYAVECYNKNHYKKNALEVRHHHNFGDATKINVNDLPDFDLLTGGFPCQAFSNAGKGLGELDTRGTLFREIIRIAEAKKPKYMLLENVKGLTTNKHKATFEKILSELDRIGYNVKWKVLNSKDFGIPQNRERVWFVCRRYDGNTETINFWKNFDFPKEEELKIFLKDILENEVDEKYYLSETKMANLIKNSNWNCNPSVKRMNGKIHKGVVNPTLTTNKGERPKILQLNNPKHSNNRVYSYECISPTLNTMQGGHRQPFIAINNATTKEYVEGYAGDGVSLEHPKSKTRRGRVQTQISPTLQCNDAKGVITECMKIRKLTPKECFRLMGFLNDEIKLDGLSNTQRYKLAGNGWDINLVSKIFKEMFKNERRN